MFPQVFGKYVLERELASGGMAVVYLATLRGAGGFEKRLVVKQIRAELASDEAFVERFVAEAKTTVGLSHPNIVPVYELGVEQGVYFIAMELAQGLTLSELLERGGPLSPEEGAHLGVEICRALDYAHRKAGIVHRDVTPRNVLIDEEGAVRLIDFGIAAPVSVEGSARERVYGSPGHMPIEQLRGGRLTPATDVFAVGALLVEAWTGRPPFRRATKVESDAALGIRPPDLSDHHESLRPLEALISRAIAFDAAARPETAEELARPLREFLRSADLGDIARRLGERVRGARRHSLAPLDGERPDATPATPSAGGLPPAPVTPATRPITQPVTETFATRDEVVEWTRPPSMPAPPPASDAVGVGRDASASREVVGTPSGSEAGAARRPPVAAGLLGARLAVLLAVLAVLATALVVGRPKSRGGDGVSGTPGAPATVSGVVPRLAPAPPSAERAAATAPATPSGSVAASPPPPDVPSTGAARTDLARASATGSEGVPLAPTEAASARASVDESSKALMATLTFTSDLPARVTLDGVAVGPTPVHGLRRAPGRHVVSVVSAELGERLPATVTVAPGQVLTVHAEFTRPAPTLRIR